MDLIDIYKSGLAITGLAVVASGVSIGLSNKLYIPRVECDTREPYLSSVQISHAAPGFIYESFEVDFDNQEFSLLRSPLFLSERTAYIDREMDGTIDFIMLQYHGDKVYLSRDKDYEEYSGAFIKGEILLDKAKETYMDRVLSKSCPAVTDLVY